ncbi:MAG: hypothetical protein H7838_06500 [Magnetococcus sp. DMHC-8]
MDSEKDAAVGQIVQKNQTPTGWEHSTESLVVPSGGLPHSSKWWMRRQGCKR